MILRLLKEEYLKTATPHMLRNDGKLIEDCASSDYIRGYNAIKEALNAVAEKNKGVYQPGLDFIERHGGLDTLVEELEKRYCK